MVDFEHYLELRPLMGTGDLLEWHSDTALGKAIRTKTGYYVNHSGLVIELQSMYSGRRIFTFEALENGVVSNFLSTRIVQHDGEMYWYRLKNEFLPDVPNIEQKAFEYLGVPYDYPSIFQQLTGSVQVDTHKLFCSEYVYVCNGGELTAPVPGELYDVCGRWEPGILV